MKNILIGTMLCIAFIACKNNPSVQSFFVKSKEDSRYTSLDISPSILQLKAGLDKNKDLDELMKGIKKVNFLMLQKEDTDDLFYTSEKEKVTSILENSTYKQLFKAKMKGIKVALSYLGNEDDVNEILLFASKKDSKDAFVICRLLGNHMNPEKIVGMLQNVQINKNSEDFPAIENLLNNL